MIQDLALFVVCFAFFSCGLAIQAAAARLIFSYTRDHALPASPTLSRVSPRFRTPVNALLIAAIIPALFAALARFTPTQNIVIGFITIPAKVNALFLLVSFAVSGIYLSFLLVVLAALIARIRGWQPAGAFRLGGWAIPVMVAATVWLTVMLVNILLPIGGSQPARSAVQLRLDHASRCRDHRRHRRHLLPHRTACATHRNASASGGLRVTLTHSIAHLSRPHRTPGDTLSRVTSWWDVVIIAAAVLGGGVIGAIVGVRLGRRTTARPPQAVMDPPRRVERRGAVYLEVALGWHAYIESARTLCFPSEGLPTERQRDLAAVLRSRAQLGLAGTTAVQRLHDEALEAAVTLINVLRSLPKRPGTGEPDLIAGRSSLRAVLFGLVDAVDRLEYQMQRELQAAAMSTEPHVEITGRPSPLIFRSERPELRRGPAARALALRNTAVMS